MSNLYSRIDGDGEIMNVFSLKDRVAIITGSTKGIGHAIACRMAEQVQKWLYPAIIRKPVMRYGGVILRSMCWKKLY